MNGKGINHRSSTCHSADAHSPAFTAGLDCG